MCVGPNFLIARQRKEQLRRRRSQFKQVPEAQGCSAGQILAVGLGLAQDPQLSTRAAIFPLLYLSLTFLSLLPCMDFSSKYSQVHREREQCVREREKQTLAHSLSLLISSLACSSPSLPTKPSQHHLTPHPLQILYLFLNFQLPKNRTEHNRNREEQSRATNSLEE